MAYNVFFDYAAIVNVLILIYAYAIHKKLPQQKNRVFLLLSIVVLLSSVTDILSSYTLANSDNFSYSIIWVLNALFYAFSCTIPFLYGLYVFSITEHPTAWYKGKYIGLFLFPYILQLVLIAISPFCHIVFSIDSNKYYIRENGLFVIYAILAYQILFSIFLLMRYGKALSRQKKNMSYSFVFFAVLAMSVQIVFPNILVQNFGISISLLLIFYSLQLSDVITDGITGLLNLNSFEIMMNRAFGKKNNFCVISICIDDIHFLSSTFGVDVLNKLLKQISFFLKEITEKGNVYNISNDVFCVVIPNCEKEQIDNITEEITNRFNRAWKNEVIEIMISARQCVIRCPDDVNSLEKLLDTIKTAVEDSRYKDKKLLYTENIDITTRQRHSKVEQLVRTAIQEDRLEVYYQPIYSVSEDRIIGAEALVRMRDRNGNFISPDEFVPIAEQCGVILRIGLYVFEQVCRFVSVNHLKDYGIKMIDVNLSAAQCVQTRICEELMSILNSYNLDSSIINLEVTETAAAHTPELMYENMKKLSNIGFACSLDDYGSGYANLNYILHMPFSMIKIDKEIVWRSIQDVNAYIMLVGVIDMIHKLNMRTVAEGIETEDMVERLKNLNCDYLQGFYYSHPIAEEEFHDLVLKQAEEKGLGRLNFEEIFPEQLYPESDSAAQQENDINLDETVEDLDDVEELEEIDDNDSVEA